MSTEMQQQQSLRQEQTMTHQQIQALEMLFAPVMELSSILSAELEKNPVLECDASEHERLEIEDVNSAENDGDRDRDRDSDQWLDKVMELDNASHLTRPSLPQNRETEEERRHFLDSLTSSENLRDELLEQLRFLDMLGDLREAAEAVISALNDDGFLVAHPADLSMATGLPVELIRQAVSVVQNLEPAGVAAKDVRERLLLQLDRKGQRGTMTWQAVDTQLDDIANNRLPKVAKALKIEMEDLQIVLREIQSLSPHMVDRAPVGADSYVREEVEISQNDDGDFDVRMNNNLLPTLKINAYYKSLLQDPKLDRETRDYIKQKISGGMFLINSLAQRQNTIERIAQVILKEQTAYFRDGIRAMRPLTMAQVADAAGVHETTVSRAVAGKYLKCRFGLIPMRFFFTPGYKSQDGSDVSNAAVKKAISEIITNEDGRHPLSDSQIAVLLKKQGLPVARRTVAKYREALSILPSNLRRQY